MDIVVVSDQRQAEAFVVAFVVVFGERRCSPPSEASTLSSTMSSSILGLLLGGWFIWLGRRMMGWGRGFKFRKYDALDGRTGAQAVNVARSDVHGVK